MPMNDQDSTSTRPYLIRALHEWCTDNGFTPYLAVRVDTSVQVPMEYVSGGEIVLNLSLQATSALRLGNDFIEFTARFSGKPHDIMVPVGRVTAIYARENGQGMAFPPPVDVLMEGVQMPPLASVPDAGAAQPVPDAGGSSGERVVQLVSSKPAAAAPRGDAPVDQGEEQGVDPTHPQPPPRPRPRGGKKPAFKLVK